MYLKRIELENLGPVEKLIIDMPFDGEKPKPLIIVGENGSGKTILLSHIVNALITGKQEVFDDGEVEIGKVYKYRSPQYIRVGSDFSYSSIQFQGDMEVVECQLRKTREIHERDHGRIGPQIWEKIPAGKGSAFSTTYSQHPERRDTLFKKQCCLYFPVNRFEEPAWLNVDNLKSGTRYTQLKKIDRYSNRGIVSTSPLKQNRDWLLDLIFDRVVYDMRLQKIPGQPELPLQIFLGFHGPSASIYDAINQLLRTVLRQPNIRLGAGPRQARQIAIMRNDEEWIPNLFQLSTGEALLLNLFLSIIRDYDLSEGEFNTLSDIKGIVVIDEIDAHLHTYHQREILPALIASFPNVQFIITTHSPLFLIGMEAILTSDQFTILNMPTGRQVTATDFSEFAAAYEAFRSTTTHREEIQRELNENARPIVFVEGDYDIRYITKAAEHLNRSALLERLQLKDGTGYGNLDKIWKGFDNPLSNAIANKIILLFDCDTRKPDATRGNVFKRTIPTVEGNPICIGIENLLPSELIERIERHNSQYIDRHEATTKRERGQEIHTPIRLSVNKDEKGNMCNWICENGVAEDFANFAVVFQIIEDILAPPAVEMD